MGCHDVSELVQRLTRLAPASASRLQRAAKAVAVPESILGEPLPPVLPAMRAALIDGEVGLDGLLAVAGPLAGLGDRVGRDLVLTADAVLAAEARGEGPDGAPPACADLLRRAGAGVGDRARPGRRRTPRDHAAAAALRGARHARARTGSCRSGVCCCPRSPPSTSASSTRSAHPASTPDGPVQFRPTTDYEPRVPTETRTRGQQQHDALATALFVAASSELLPTIGGAAPTLVVSARADDVIAGTGWASVEGCDEPVGIAAAQHAGCAGVVQRVLVRRQRPDPPARHRRTRLQPPATPRHRTPRRRLHHPRLRRPRRLVRDPPCPRTRQRRQDPHRQRRHALLVPPPIPRPARLGDPHEPRRPRSPRTTLVRPHPTMAHRHQIHTTTPRPRRRPVLTPTSRGGVSRCHARAVDEARQADHQVCG